MDELSISVNIADRIYKLTVERKEEESVRKAEKQIREQLKKFASLYAFKDKQDLLAMVALQFSNDAVRLEDERAFQDEGLVEKLMEIDEMLDPLVQEKEK